MILAVYGLYLTHKKETNTTKYKNIEYWKMRVEFVFTSLMAFLLIYLFNPRTSRANMVTGETKILLYLFGFVLLITANWSVFIKESIWFQHIQQTLQ
jgi:hypothetical protein